VKFLPPLINKNNKSDREKNHEYLAKGSFNFNQTKKFGISTKNYTRKNLRLMIWTRVKILELNKKIEQLKKIEGCNLEKNRRNTILIEMIM
jgi:hypothetical protein